MTISEVAASVHLSLIVPAFNEEQRIGSALTHIAAFLRTLPYACEVIVVDDGSAEAGRRAVTQALIALPPEIEHDFVRHETNRGKGAAVRSGCLIARGDYVAFIDADLATPPEELSKLLEALVAGADVAIGVRRQQDGSDMRNRRGFARRLAGGAYSFAMRALVLPGVSDSQCPLKAFRHDAARAVFGMQRIETWAFDAELLYIANRLGLRVAQTPVVWHAVEGSHLRLNLRSALEVWNLLRIRWWHRGLKTAPEPARDLDGFTAGG
jgi:dolichyl-phosphate beta-glucosyltransferase